MFMTFIHSLKYIYVELAFPSSPPFIVLCLRWSPEKPDRGRHQRISQIHMSTICEEDEPKRLYQDCQTSIRVRCLNIMTSENFNFLRTWHNFFSHKVWKTPAFVSQISPFSIFSLSVRSINITENIMKKQEGVLAIERNKATTGLFSFVFGGLDWMSLINEAFG